MKDVIIEVLVLYTGLFGAVVYRWGDVYMAFLGGNRCLAHSLPFNASLAEKGFHSVAE